VPSMLIASSVVKKFKGVYIHVSCWVPQQNKLKIKTVTHTVAGTRTNLHTCIRTYMHTYIHACVHTCMRTYMHAYIHAGVHTCMRTFMHAYIHACVNTCMRTNMHAYTHACVHTCMRTYMHAYIHTDTDMFKRNIEFIIFSWFQCLDEFYLKQKVIVVHFTALFQNCPGITEVKFKLPVTKCNYCFFVVC
jgi:hypothetical protein